MPTAQAHQPAPRANLRLWTTARKLQGNLVPFLVAGPFVAAGVWRLVQTESIFYEPLAWFGAAVATLWLAVNFLGLWGNEGMKRTLRNRMRASLHPNEIPPEPFFAGFARPTYRSVLDPHEDIGFILLHPDRIEFFGDHDRITLAKANIASVRLRPNPHSWALLGGWVSVEGVLDGQKVRMYFEPRECRTLLGNRALRGSLLRRLRKWLEERKSD